MKKSILVASLLTSFVFLSACGGGGEQGKTPVVVIPPVVDNPKEDMGQLPTITSDEDVSDNFILNIQGIQKDNITSNLDKLKICTDTACWTILNNSGQAKSAMATKKVTKLTSSTSIVDIGTYNLSDVDGEINAIEYFYNAKKGELKLDNPVKTTQDLPKNLYLGLAENLSVPFSSLSIKNGRHGVFIPEDDFKKEFINGVIVEVEQRSADEMAHMYIASIGKISDDNLEASSYLMDFYIINPTLDDFSDMENEFQEVFSKDIRVYLPISIRNSNPQYIVDNYILDVNSSKTEFQIVEQNSRHYILFTSKFSTLQIHVLDKAIFEEGF